MITKEKLNLEVDKYNQKLLCNIPYIQDVIYVDGIEGKEIDDAKNNFNAKVEFDDLLNGSYILYINKSSADLEYEEQVSLLWHEFTHIADYLSFCKSYDKDELLCLMKTYSEAHAASIQEKYINPEINEDQCLERAVSDLIRSRDYFNKKMNKNVFHLAISVFMYFCGRIKLLDKQNQEICKSQIQIRQFNKDYVENLKLLYDAYLDDNKDKMISIYVDMIKTWHQ